MKEVVRPGEVLGFRKCGGRIAEVWRMIIEKGPTVLARCSPGKGNPHCRHRLYSGCFYPQQLHTPCRERVSKRSTRSRLSRNQEIPHWPSLSVKRFVPLSGDSVCVENPMRLEQFLPGHLG